jgi:hypothetical protein
VKAGRAGLPPNPISQVTIETILYRIITHLRDQNNN